MTRTAMLGGETGRRGRLGGTANPARTRAITVSVIVAMVLTLTLREIGVLISVVVGALALVVTAGGRDSLMAKRRAAAQVKDATKRGVAVFRPYDREQWEQLCTPVKGRAERRARQRERAAMRQMPTAADGLGWLDLRSGQPGIQWHQPMGEAPYLAVVFTVSGQLTGLQSTAATDNACRLWGEFQASLGALTSRADMLQTLTRVVPADSARYEAWAIANVDRKAPRELLRSYDQLLRSLASSMVQRHYVVVGWPLDASFLRAAARLGQGREGWRSLMDREIASMRRRISAAGLGRAELLTARQTAAVMRNMQHPAWPIDQARDVDPTNFGLQSVPAAGAHHVQAPGPDGQVADWFHATAVADTASIAALERTGLWMLPVLSGMRTPIVRTISVNRLVVPASQAKQAAREDLASDKADQIARRRKGQLSDDETDARARAAARRRHDLRAGSGNAGVEYQIAVTVSAPSENALGDARSVITEAFDSGLGIERLVWQDSVQSAASGLTWPMARGLRRAEPTLGAKFERYLVRS